jgi:chloride channel protein, CIC family
MAFTITFRRARVFMIHWPIPHWIKLTLGGFLTGLCGLTFLEMYHGSLIPLGPNYEAVGQILGHHHNSLELVVFGVLKLAATLFTLASGGVSAMFVPLFLTGGSFGTAFAQTIVHSGSVELYAAVGMASFIAAGYKTPLAAVVFVAEATGGHAFIIPALIGAAVAYGISGEASASGDQRLHEGFRIQELSRIPVSQIMQSQVVSIASVATLQEFADSIATQNPHNAFPVVEGEQVLGWIATVSLNTVPHGEWATTKVEQLTQRHTETIPRNFDVMEALRLLLGERHRPMLFVASQQGALEGIVTKSDILTALQPRLEHHPPL